MRNVMWKGELAGTIALDTIANKQGLYGLGPMAYLAGELMIVDGKSYKSTVLSDSTMAVEETYAVEAPFFVYANVGEMKASAIPDSIQTIKQLEAYLDEITKSAKRPFAFKLTGPIKKAKIHVLNLPEGAKVSSPAEAHRNQVSYHLTHEQAEIIGFFSTEHKAVFTHHDTFLHMHLLTADRSKMGHLDEALFGKGIKLYLPVE
ncbi:acetolactate decarboxylase [uncultured Pontibacter sp.]|uniref:acetolactate decarboxylase n=1 Tax=uncultured Pontibacter sp. TaxID=453356 RepID=UPI002622183D|nr:acetolactate decarboxylase [uncultured Pontibacter sp.]